MIGMLVDMRGAGRGSGGGVRVALPLLMPPSPSTPPPIAGWPYLGGQLVPSCSRGTSQIEGRHLADDRGTSPGAPPCGPYHFSTMSTPFLSHHSVDGGGGHHCPQ